MIDTIFSIMQEVPVVPVRLELFTSAARILTAVAGRNAVMVTVCVHEGHSVKRIHRVSKVQINEA